MAEFFRYAAFISYSSKDSAFAKRLHVALESYRIPTALGHFDLLGGGGKKNRIYPVFRDREELSAGALDERIEASLKSSGAMIVISSPNTAGSSWVHKEIDYFVALGRRDRIFVIIPDTAPLIDEAGADATPLCLLPVFRADAFTGPNPLEPLAADARKGKDGFRQAWLKIVAGLVGVSPGQLIDRDTRRQRQRATAIAGAALVIVLSTLTAMAWIDTQNWRTILTAESEAIGQDRPADARAFAVAGVTVPGDVLFAQGARGDEALQNLSMVHVERDLGWLADNPCGIAFSKDSNHLVWLSAGGVGGVAEIGTKKPNHTLPAHSITLSSNGGLMATWTYGQGFVIHDLTSNVPGQPTKNVGTSDALTRSQTGACAPVALAQSQTGTILVAQVIGGAVLYDSAKPESKIDPLRAWYVHLTPDGKRLFLRLPNGTITVVDTGTQQVDRVLDDVFDWGVRVARNGAAVAIYDGGAASLRLYDITKSGAKTVIPVSLARFSADNSSVVAVSPGGMGTYFDLNRGVEKVDLGPLGKLREFTIGDKTNPAVRDGGLLLSANGARMLTSEQGDVMAHNLAAGGAKTVLGRSIGNTWRLKDIRLSQNGAILFTRSEDNAGSYFDLANGGAKIALGDLGQLRGLTRKSETDDGRAQDFGVGLSADGSVLVTRNEDGLATLYDMKQNGAKRSLGNLGRLRDMRISDDGTVMVTMADDGSGSLIALRTPAPALDKASQHPHAGTALHNAVCANEADAMRPFPDTLRNPATPEKLDPDQKRVYYALRGRPWNPCDWRGILAFKNGELEGLAQWWRLVSVQFNLAGAKDYSCAEVDAAGRTSPARQQACAQRHFHECDSTIGSMQLASQTWTVGINKVSARLGSFQKDLFEGRCADHPIAKSFVTQGKRMMREGGLTVLD